MNHSKLGRKDRAFGYLVVFPYLAYTAVFWGYPFIWMIVLAFTKWNYSSKPQFVFFQNFLRILSDSMFMKISLNTLNFLAYLVPMMLSSSLLLHLH
jgi:multiple sugar transport system permease protein